MSSHLARQQSSSLFFWWRRWSWLWWKEENCGSIQFLILMLRKILRDSFHSLTFAYCFTNWSAIAEWLVYILSLKEIGWFGAWLQLLFPDNPFIKPQKRPEFDFWLAACTASIHHCLEVAAMEVANCWFKSTMARSFGSRRRNSSLSLARRAGSWQWSSGEPRIEEDYRCWQFGVIARRSTFWWLLFLRSYCWSEM